MHIDEWMQRFDRLTDPVAKRFLLLLLAFDEAQPSNVRQTCLKKAIGITDDQLHAAMLDIERVGIGKIGWVN